MTEKEYIKIIKNTPCIITGTQAVPHHVKCFNNGWGKVSDFLTIPLCPDLHTLRDDSIHRNKKLFEDRYGREIDLLAETIKIIASR